MEIIQIILFASVAVVLALRLYSLLGRKEGHMDPPSRREAGERIPQDDEPLMNPNVRPAFTGPGAAGMEAIRAADGVFDPSEFVNGARGAYEMIVTAFAQGDRDTLQSLLNPTAFQKWSSALDARDQADRRQISELVRIVRAEIEDAALVERTARVEVRFEADISNTVVDAHGAPADGAEGKVGRVEEVWVFERSVDSAEPNWFLVRVKKA